MTDTQTLDAFLAHHGVLGMHWGVRKDDGSELANITDHFNTENEKFGLELAGGGLAAAALVTAAVLSKGKIKPSVFKTGFTKLEEQRAPLMKEFWSYSGGTKLTESNLHLDDVHLPAGSVYHRLSGSTERGVQEGRLTYASLHLDDFDRYVATWGTSGRTQHVQITTKANTKIAGLETTISHYQKALNLTRAEAIQRVGSDAGGYTYRPEATDDLGKVIKSLRADGYGGMYDHMDAGMIADRPIALFHNASEVSFSHSFLTPEQVRATQKKVKIMTSPKGGSYLSDLTHSSMERGANFLEHHGVLGQKWGIRHDPKKAPVTREQTIARTAKAQKFVKEASASQSRIDAYKKLNPRFQFQQRSINKKIEEETAVRDRALKNVDRKKDGKLSLDQRNVLIAGGVVAGFIAAKGLHANVQSGQITRLVSLAKNGEKATNFARKESLAQAGLSVDDLMKDVVKGVNPKYGDIGTKMNCRRATFAYEMRRRGYDVTATRTTTGEGQNAAGLVNALSPGEKLLGTGKNRVILQATREAVSTAKETGKKTPLTDISQGFGAGARNKIGNASSETVSSHEIFEALAKQPNGSRGELGVTWNVPFGLGGGHSVAYEIVHGKPVIFDTQIGAFYDNAEDLALNWPAGVSNAGFTRLDNVQLNANYLLRWLQNA